MTEQLKLMEIALSEGNRVDFFCRGGFFEAQPMDKGLIRVKELPSEHNKGYEKTEYLPDLLSDMLHGYSRDLTVRDIYMPAFNKNMLFVNYPGVNLLSFGVDVKSVENLVYLHPHNPDATRYYVSIKNLWLEIAPKSLAFLKRKKPSVFMKAHIANLPWI